MRNERRCRTPPYSGGDKKKPRKISAAFFPTVNTSAGIVVIVVVVVVIVVVIGVIVVGVVVAVRVVVVRIVGVGPRPVTVRLIVVVALDRADAETVIPEIIALQAHAVVAIATRSHRVCRRNRAARAGDAQPQQRRNGGGLQRVCQHVRSPAFGQSTLRWTRPCLLM